MELSPEPKFHKKRSNGSSVMTGDGRTDGRTDGQTDRQTVQVMTIPFGPKGAEGKNQEKKKITTLT